jgi:hypothetical protein
MRKILVVICFSLLSACISQIAPFESHIKGMQGGKIEEVIRIRNLPHASRANYKGIEQITQLNNGNKLYEFPYPECPVFFEVNPQGIIVKISTENNKPCY